MVRLLVVHDDGGQRPSIVDAALAAHIDRRQIRTVESWEEAEGALLEPFDLAVIDIDLWGRDEGGIELIRRLHDRQPDCKIIALTSQRGGDVGACALEEGAREFIFTKWKHINWVQLLEEQLKLYK